MTILEKFGAAAAGLTVLILLLVAGYIQYDYLTVVRPAALRGHEVIMNSKDSKGANVEHQRQDVIDFVVFDYLKKLQQTTQETK